MAQTTKQSPIPVRPSSGYAVAQFVVVFAMLVGGFFVATATPLVPDAFYGANFRLNARLSAAVLRLFGETAEANGHQLTSPRTALVISRGCDAIAPAVLYVAAVVAFPVPWRRRLAGVTVGVPLLLVLNLARIVTLYYASAYRPDVFDLLHLDVWQALFIFVTMALWLAWARWAMPAPRTAAHAPA